MTSDSGEPLDRPGIPPERPDEAPEADVLDQRLSPTGDDEESEEFDVPPEADPADVVEQHRSAGETDDGDYR